MVDLAELRNWILAFILAAVIFSSIIGLVWLCITYPGGVLWVIFILVAFIFIHRDR